MSLLHEAWTHHDTYHEPLVCHPSMIQRSLLHPVQWLRTLSQSYTWKLLAMVACTNHLLKVGCAVGLHTPGLDLHISRTSTEQKLTPEISQALWGPILSFLEGIVWCRFVTSAPAKWAEKTPLVWGYIIIPNSREGVGTLSTDPRIHRTLGG